jgi:hypothetical protein
MIKKIISLVCESMNRYDITDFSIPFIDDSMFYEMDLEASEWSVKALYLMQKDDNLPELSVATRESLPSIFIEEGKFIANYTRTRIFSNFWPKQWSPEYLDPKCNVKSLHTHKIEPLTPYYPAFLSFLKDEFYKSDYAHVIYWSAIGHPGDCRRIEEENNGVPPCLKKTIKYWFELIQKEIIPLIDKENTIVLIHPDHKTAREGIDYKLAQSKGFLYFYPKVNALLNNNTIITWKDIRKTIRNATGVDNIMPYHESGNIIGQ